MESERPALRWPRSPAADSMLSHLSSPLSQSMTLAASTLDGPIDVDELLHLICLAAIDTVPGAEYAGITLADRHPAYFSKSATSQLLSPTEAEVHRGRRRQQPLAPTRRNPSPSA